MVLITEVIITINIYLLHSNNKVFFFYVNNFQS